MANETNLFDSLSEPGTPPLPARSRSKRRRTSNSRSVSTSTTTSSSTTTTSSSSIRRTRSRKRRRKRRKRSSKTSNHNYRSNSSRRRDDQSSQESSLINRLVSALEEKKPTTLTHGSQNVISEFDPQAKVQDMKDWLSKINESAQVYGWSERQIIYLALPRLTGLAKRWYEGLKSIKFTWAEWQAKLIEAFPCEDNYGDLLTEMLARKSRKNETLEEYYYDKIRLINRCNITGEKAVDCLTHGIFDHNIRMNSQGLCLKNPADVLTYFRKISTKQEDSFKKNVLARNARPYDNRTTSIAQRRPMTVNSTFSKVLCFNCKESGHNWRNCSKEIIRCTKCRRVGHTLQNCNSGSPGINTTGQPSTSVQKRVMAIEEGNESGNKYYKTVTINNVPFRSFIDLGSECTLIGNSTARNIGAKVEVDTLPLLKGFGNNCLRPDGKVRIRIKVDEVEDDIDAYVIPQELLHNGTHILVGQNFTELSHVRVYKTNEELNFFEINRQNIKINVRDKVTVTGTMPVTVVADAPCKFIYISSEACLKPNAEYLIIPGIYTFEDKISEIMIMNLADCDVNLNKGHLLARGKMIPELPFLSSKQEECTKKGLVLNVCRIATQDGDGLINRNSIKTDKHLDPLVLDDLETLLKEYRTCFAFSTAELGKTTLAEMQIRLKDDNPVTYRPYRLSVAERMKVKEMIDDLLTNNIIRESESEYASPIIVVPKKNGDKRLCVDYRALNKKTAKDRYPMPLIEDQIDSLSGKKYFTTLDLASGYHQIPILEECKHLTAFVTPDGHFEYNRMPFGLCNAPAVFQRLIHKVLRSKQVSGVLAYMDDIIVASESIAEGMTKLRNVLEVLKEANLTLNLSKCHFFGTCIDYLGYEISSEGIKPGLRKIEAVESFKPPSNVHEVRQFIGLASFFRRFVKGFASVARPLTMLTKTHQPWIWGSDQVTAFANIKDILVSRPVLAIYDPSKLTELHTDASKIGYGGILLQRSDDKAPLRVVAYFSKQTTEEEQKFHSYELETLAVIMSLKRFRSYLIGIEFKIVTDCNAVRMAWSRRDLVPRIARWWLQAQEYNFNIEYKPGAQMSHADALSRNPVVNFAVDVTSEDAEINILKITTTDGLLDVQLTDPLLSHIKCILDTNCADAKEIRNNYVLKEGRIYRKIGESLKWAVPRDARWKICHMNHDECGPMAFEKTINKIQQSYWFPNMTSFVRKYVKACIPCGFSKQPSGRKEGFLHPIPKTPIPFYCVHIDHLGPFVKSNRGHMHILCIIDGFTKFIILRAVRNTKTKTTVSILRDVFGIFGAPKLLISDRGTSFTSSEFEKFAQELEIKHVKNAVSMPRANGQIERYNRSITASLIALTHGANDKDWDTHLNTVQWSLNNTLNKGIGRTPAEVIFCKQTINTNETYLHDIAEANTSLNKDIVEEIRDKALENIENNQVAMKERFDKKRCAPKQYNEGDLVLVQKQLNNPGESNKLLPRYSGPYKVTKILGNDRYEVSSIEGYSKRAYKNVYTADTIKPWITLSGANANTTNLDGGDKGSESESN